MQKDFSDLYFLAEEYPPKRKTSNIRIKYSDHYKKLVELTGFLPLDNTTTSQRLWHIRNNNCMVPECKMKSCDRKVKWITKDCDYADFCSVRCYNKSKTVRAKKNYEKVQEKKYGKGWESLTSYEKYKITNKKIHGYENPFKDVDFIKSKNREKYQRDFHFQSHIDQSVLDKLNDPKWLFEQNHTLKKPCVQIAGELGLNNTTVNKSFQRLGIDINYEYSGSYAELLLKQFLVNRKLEFVHNDRTTIPPYEVDFLLKDQKVAIEYCGLYWHNELHKDKHYHQRKYQLLKDVGIQLITIFEDEYINNPQLVERMLLYKMGCYVEKSIHPRNCTIREVSKSEKRVFLDTNHIQGNGPGSVSLGMFTSDNDLVAVMTFIQNENDVYTLNRFCTSGKSPGSFDKMLAYFKKKYKWKRIVTFADLRWSDGALYKKMGFDRIYTIPPDYYYIKNNQRFHKFNFRHKNLKKMFPDTYDSTLSEHKNCLNHKIFRIYDCGKHKYQLSNNKNNKLALSPT